LTIRVEYLILLLRNINSAKVDAFSIYSKNGEETEMYFVYELVDPRTDVTGYIGITNNPNQRYYDHIDGRDKRKTKKREWIKRLQEELTQPKMKILEIVDDIEQASIQERYWIRHYIDKGVQLANTLLVTRKDSTLIDTTPDDKGIPSLPDIAPNDKGIPSLPIAIDPLVNHFECFECNGLIFITIPNHDLEGFHMLKGDERDQILTCISHIAFPKVRKIENIYLYLVLIRAHSTISINCPACNKTFGKVYGTTSLGELEIMHKIACVHKCPEYIMTPTGKKVSTDDLYPIEEFSVRLT
jgi:predicted GIY-YIG superfamily endonuclease